MKTALTIAGSDSGGGAGIQADIKTFSALGVFGMSAITAITSQNTVEVRSVQLIDVNIINDQVAAVLEDIGADAVKIGMLATPDIIQTVAQCLKKYKPKHIVLDPVMISKGGHRLLEEDTMQELKSTLIPLASLVTPNIPEAEVLANMPIHNEPDMYEACRVIKKLGAQAVLIKGGHLQGNPNDLYYEGQTFQLFRGERIETKNVHGTGCTLSAAIAALLAKGKEMPTAIDEAKDYITNAIANSLNIGQGYGPTHHFYHLYECVT